MARAISGFKRAAHGNADEYIRALYRVGQRAAQWPLFFFVMPHSISLWSTDAHAPLFVQNAVFVAGDHVRTPAAAAFDDGRARRARGRSPPRGWRRSPFSPHAARQQRRRHHDGRAVLVSWNTGMSHSFSTFPQCRSNWAQEISSRFTPPKVEPAGARPR
jgi:hypothetical protein